MNFKSFTQLSLSLVLFFSACEKRSPVRPGPDNGTEKNRRIVILYTNDEHGWMEGTENTGGAAELAGRWKQTEGYTPDGPYLILSGGDMWTGPAISTWFEGESMVEVMNKMNYSAAAIGNHEFDFKIEGLKERIAQSTFPFLSANIREKTTGDIPDFVQPYLVKKVNGVKVGIIGLTTITTPVSTFPDYVRDYDFIPYDTALREFVPRAKQDGAELLISIGHICQGEMRALAPTASELGITMLTGGHCSELVSEMMDGVALIEGGFHLRSYAKADIMFDAGADTVVGIALATYANTGGTPDPDISAAISHWKSQLDVQLSQAIGFVNSEIPRRSDAMYNLVTDSWLAAYPSADVSLTNAGGIRQSIPAGNITKATIVGLMPFENNIIELQLTGTELMQSIGYLIMGGMTAKDGYKLSDGTPIHPDSTYKVLTIDYLYARPDIPFSRYDSQPYHTGIHYRQPVIDWITPLNTSAADPLDNYLDYDSRR